jgi:hypothetical protein
LSAEEYGPIVIAERIEQLVRKAPAGGPFTHADISETAGVEIDGFGGAAGFTIKIDDDEYRVMVQWV